MYKQYFAKTKRIKTAYFRTENHDLPKLLLLHGNLSSSVFFLPLVPYLKDVFDVVIPDMRCFGDTQDLPVDGRRGFRDWSDDIFELTQALGWEKFSIGGWSMGGNVAMQFAIDHYDRIDRMVLIAPGSPFGFGGTVDEKGTPMHPLGLCSGGGCCNQQLLVPLKSKNRYMLRDILNTLYFNPPFRMSKEWEDILLDGIAKIKIGDGRYPGDYRMTFFWPFVMAGDRGVLNTMSPGHGNLSALVDIPEKPPILWIRGLDDKVVSDHSMLDMAELGRLGMIPGWPGMFFAPPQPMISQTRYVMNQYRENGGDYLELVIPGGHMCALESAQHFTSAMCSFLLERPDEAFEEPDQI